MRSSKNKDVQDFLKNLETIDHKRYDLLVGVREVVFQIHESVSEKMMYGGIIFFIGSDMFSGVFAYKSHVSIEFSNGYLMEDKAGLLEGKGKFRRHLKIKTKDDIEEKSVAYYVEQAI